MTALENVAVPLELAGVADASERARDELAAVGLGERLHHYPAQLSGGEQQRVAVARALAPNPAILVADEPTGNLDEDTGRQIIDLLFAGHAKRGTTLVLVTHDAALAARCDRVVRLRSGRIDGVDARHERCRTAVARDGSRWLPLRFALREMRGGLRGFYVFIACIALGVMAIAGVGSLAASLADGLAREGQVILGGDLSFTLIQREATPDERRFLQSRGTMSRPPRTMRAMARDRRRQGRRWSRSRRSTAPIRCSAQAALDPPGRSPMPWRNATASSAPPPIRPCWRGSASSRRRALTIGNADDRNPRRAHATSRTSSPAASASARGCWSARTALRATGLLQPGSLVRWHYRLRLPAERRQRRRRQGGARRKRARNCREAGWEIRTRTNASPQLERNVERFTQFLTIVGLTALLVGGVGVGNAVKSHLDRRREVIATMKALGASGAPRVRDLSDAGAAAGADRRRHRHRARRDAAVR